MPPSAGACRCLCAVWARPAFWASVRPCGWPEVSRVEAFEAPGQAGAGQFAHMGIYKVALGVVEQGSWQAVAADYPAKTVLPVAEYVAQVQILFHQELADGFRVFALVGEDKVHVRITLLGFFQHWHLTDAGRAPAGPQIHHRGLVTGQRSEEHTSELQSRPHLVCRLLLEKKKKKKR